MFHMERKCFMDKETLQDIAIKVLIANRGASMQDIAAAAGIGRTTLHRYFASRDELLRELTLAALNDANKATIASRLEEGTALEALERAITINIPIGHRFHFLLNEWRFDNEEEVHTKNSQQLDAYEALMRRGQQEGIFRNDLPARWMVNTLTALVFMACESIRDGYTAPRDAPRLVLTTLLAGISQQ
jgi:AcrR family transcriptional regulator